MWIYFLANIDIELCLVKLPSMSAAALLYSGIKLFPFLLAKVKSNLIEAATIFLSGTLLGPEKQDEKWTY